MRLDDVAAPTRPVAHGGRPAQRIAEAGPSVLAGSLAAERPAAAATT